MLGTSVPNGLLKGFDRGGDGMVGKEAKGRDGEDVRRPDGEVGLLPGYHVTGGPRVTMSLGCAFLDA